MKIKKLINGQSINLIDTQTRVAGIGLYASHSYYRDHEATYYVDAFSNNAPDVVEMGRFESYENALIEFDIYIKEEIND